MNYRNIIAIILLSAQFCFAGYRNIIIPERRDKLPGSIEYPDGRVIQGDLTIEQCAEVGWRIEDDAPPVVAPGIVIVSEEWQQDLSRPLYLIRVVTATRTQAEQDAIDAEAAAQQAWLASRPLEAPNGVVSGNGIVYLPASPDATNGWAVGVDADGVLITAHWYGSPTSTVEEIKAAIGSRSASNNAVRLLLRELRTNVAAEIDFASTNVANFQAVNRLANGFTAAENRNAVNDLRAAAIENSRSDKEQWRVIQDIRRILTEMNRE